MTIKEISNGYFNEFFKNPKQLDLFLMYRYTQKLDNNIAKLAEIDKQQNQDLGISQ